MSGVFSRFALETARQERAAFGRGVGQRPVFFLALSGAGVLCGGTVQGTRPRLILILSRAHRETGKPV